jgi:hypothetical protein
MPSLGRVRTLRVESAHQACAPSEVARACAPRPWADLASSGPRGVGPRPLLVQARLATVHYVRWDAMGFQPIVTVALSFPFGLYLYLNFKKSYLSVQSSKNYETSFIGFIIL